MPKLGDRLALLFIKMDVFGSGISALSVANSFREVKCNGPPCSFAVEQAAQKGREPAKKQIAKGWPAPLGRAEVPAQWTETSTDILFWAGNTQQGATFGISLGVHPSGLLF